MISFKITVWPRFSFRFALALAGAILWILAAGTPAHALNPGCTCPAGSIPVVGTNSCSTRAAIIPATCVTPTPLSPNTNALKQSIGHVAASSQQLSFEGVQSILESRRDQLQGTLGTGKATSMISGYAPSDFDQGFDALGYASAAKRANPLATPVYKAPQAPVSSGPSFAAWAQGLGDWEHDDAASAADIGHFAKTYAAQAGIDGTWQNLSKAGDALVIGVVGSYTHAHVSYDGSPTTTMLQGPGVGLYGTYVNGGFSVDLTGKFDFLGLTEDFAGLAPNNSVSVTNGGASGNMQYKIEFSRGFAEPTAGFSYTRTMFGSGAAVIGLADASTVRLQAGTRFGSAWNQNGISFEPSLKALVYSNVIAEGSAAANSVIAGIVPTDEGKVRGEVAPDLNLDFGNGCSATLSGTVRFGQGMLGGSAGVNLRKQW